MQFNTFGFFKEYYIGNKFIGFVECEKDGREIGYSGRKKETLQSQIVFKNGKRIKAGVEVTTIIYPLCANSIK